MILKKWEKILGIANIDLFPLCSKHYEQRVLRLQFEREESDNQSASSHRKISCDARFSSDEPILKESIDNSFFVTFDSICNFDATTMEVQQLKVGMMAPLGSQLSKSIVFTGDLATSSLKQGFKMIKRWLKLSHVSGKGAESAFQVKPYEYRLTRPDENLLSNLRNQMTLNTVARVILPERTKTFFHDHVKKMLKVAVEVMIGKEHLMGFVNLSELMHVGRKKIRAFVPLLKFNNDLLLKNCTSESVFAKAKDMERKSKKEADKKKVKSKTASSMLSLKNNLTDIDQVAEIPYLNEQCQQVFIIVELELEKPLNEETHEDSHEELLPDKLSITSAISDAPRKSLENFREQLDLVTKNIFKIYDKETDVNKITARMIADGYFTMVEDHLLGKLNLDLPSKKNFEEFKSDAMCQLTSKVLNIDCYVQNESNLILMAKVFSYMGMQKESDEIFLRRIYKIQCEQTWIDYAVHSLKNEKFSKALACIDKALSHNPHSIIGHILQAYISFKLQNYSESERLIRFMQYKHNDSTMELSLILHLVNIKKGEKFELTLDPACNVQKQIQQVYDSIELLWFATADAKNFLSWQDPFIRSAILFIKLGCFDFAELSLGEYYAKHGVNVNYSYLLAVIDAVKGDFSNSLIHLNKISKQDIGNHQVNYQKITMLMSLMLIKLGKFDRAEKLIVDEVFSEKKEVENFLINYMLGNHNNLIGDHKKSNRLLSSAHNIFPSHLTFLELGKSYQGLSEILLAEICFHQTVNEECRSQDAWQHLYDIYMKQNRVELAVNCMQNLKGITMKEI